MKKDQPRTYKRSYRRIIILAIILLIVLLAFTMRGSDKNTLNLSDYDGKYENPEGFIALKALDNRFMEISGEVVWSNSITSSIGEIKGKIEVKNNKALYQDKECEIELSIEKEKIQAKDNNKCGGFNVSFTGEYLKPNTTK